MPVHGDNFDRGAARHFSRGAELHVQQRENSAEQVHTVRPGENIKETAAGVRRQENSFSGKLAPGENLPGDEKNAKECRSRPPVAESFVILRCEPVVCTRKSEAAGD